MSDAAWRIFCGDYNPDQGGQRLEQLLTVEAPQWRRFGRRRGQTIVDAERDRTYWQRLQEIAQTKERDLERGSTFRLRLNTDTLETDDQSSDQSDYDDVLNAVNAALYLRRPLLITGRPGSGKTSLAYAIAYELQLGPVLLWPITARSTLQEGLFQYDAIARLQDANLQTMLGAQEQPAVATNSRDIGQYIRLGPVGTAFLPSSRPRVLLIDEIDKSDINLPNELLNLFEEGTFEIPPLVRLAKQAGDQPSVQQVQSEDGLTVPVEAGRVPCQAFPLIIMTSNGERDFPPAFYRRCLRVSMPDPTVEVLKDIVKAHLGQTNIDEFEALIQDFERESAGQETGLATDQLLNIVYLLKQNADEAKLKRLLFKPLTELDNRP
jgi:MoxR-like ATPase